MLATHTNETCARNLHENLMQVRHSFLHNNNWPANHIARFVSRAGQFLCWNRAVLNCVKETGTRKNLSTIDQHMCKFLVQDDLLARVSGTSFLSVCRRHFSHLLTFLAGLMNWRPFYYCTQSMILVSNGWKWILVPKIWSHLLVAIFQLLQWKRNARGAEALNFSKSLYPITLPLRKIRLLCQIWLNKQCGCKRKHRECDSYQVVIIILKIIINIIIEIYVSLIWKWWWDCGLYSDVTCEKCKYSDYFIVRSKAVSYAVI